MDTNYEDLDRDLKQRWRPSQMQVSLAERYLHDKHADECYSVQILVGKHFGFWTSDVVVVNNYTCLFPTRDEASEFAQGIVKQYKVATGSYARHTAGEQWAVFEDILARSEAAK